MIKVVAFDIDGVLTNGEVSVDSSGKERKSFNLKEADALNDFQRNGIKIAAITAEKNDMTAFFESRFSWDKFYSGYKDKVAAINDLEKEMGISSEEICFIGDGKYDVEAIRYAGVGVCPKDAISSVKIVADVILESIGGHGCIYELLERITEINRGSISNYVMKRFTEHKDVVNRICLDQNLQDKIMTVANEILNTIRRGNAIYFCGNGGSAADAQHLATEFVSRFFRDRKAINAEALSVNTSSLTAIANDYSFDRVFARQLEAKGRKGDALIGISTSGASENIWEAFQYARENEILTILLTSRKAMNNKRENLLDYVIDIPSESVPRIQEMHIIVGHIWAEYVEEYI